MPASVSTAPITPPRPSPAMKPVNRIGSAPVQDSQNSQAKLTGSDSITVNVPCPHAILPPECGNDGAEQRSVGEHGGRNNPGQGNGAPVGQPLAPLLALAHQPEVAD